MKTLSALTLTACLTLIGCADGSSAPNPEVLNASNKVEATVTGMDCSGCTGSVCSAVEQIAGVTGAQADLKTGKVTVALEDEADSAAISKEIESVISGLSDGKYTVTAMHKDDNVDKPAEEETAPAQDPTPSEDAEQTSQVETDAVFVSTSYIVKGMDCSGCSGEIETAVKQVTGVTDVKANHMTGKVEVAFEDKFDDKKKTDEIKTVISKLGDGKYTVSY